MFGLSEPFGCGGEDKLCFDLFTRVCFSWLRSFFAVETFCPPPLQPVRRSAGLDRRYFRLALDSRFTKLYLLLKITPFDVCFILKLALGRRPASRQEDAEQKLLSAPLLLVAIETRAMMESRRVWGRAGRLQ